MSTIPAITPLILNGTDAEEELTTIVFPGGVHKLFFSQRGNTGLMVAYGHITEDDFRERAELLLSDLRFAGDRIVERITTVQRYALIGFDDQGETIIKWHDDREFVENEGFPRVTLSTPDAQPVTFSEFTL